MNKTKKTLFVCTFITLFMWSIWFETICILFDKTMAEITKNSHRYSGMKYILQWTNSYKQPFIFMGRGQATFINRNCSVNNCFVTPNRTLLSSLKDFDAILFHGPELNPKFTRLPKERSAHQKYVFVSKESSSNHPVNYKIYEDYFNWTWTYRLNSDVYYGYIIIKNKSDAIIGPKEVMHWMKVDEMKPIDLILKQKLSSKKIAAAWFVSHCHVKSKRRKVAKLLQRALAKYNLTVDIYGGCGTKCCSRIDMEKCLRILETDYYFYLAFENSFSEDYVTEKLLHALQHYTVPIVYGGANYTRFMPDGTYLQVQTHNVKEIVKQMVDIINNKQKYFDYFRWTNHYSYHNGCEFPETDYYCEFCRKINDANLVAQRSTLHNFKQWWNHNTTDNKSPTSITTCTRAGESINE